MRRVLTTTVLIASTAAAFAGPLAPPVRAEIDALLAALGASGCQFSRNGSWHGAAEARRHLERKLDYLTARDAVHSTEAFIEMAASSSSLTGQPYRVKCGAEAPVESRRWLEARLAVIRTAMPSSTTPR